MAKDEAHREKALARKAARREKKVARHHTATGAGPFRAAADWPLYECQVSRSWREPGQIVQILVARSAGAKIAVAGFLVDLSCLGVKDALSHVLSAAEYREFRHSYLSRQPMERADLNLVAKIIQEGAAYADRLGFRPNPDFAQAAQLLAGADPGACVTPIPLGVDGKPFFMPGPFDDAPAIVRQLERAVGPGNFHYALPFDDLDLTDEDDTASDALDEKPASLLPWLPRRADR